MGGTITSGRMRQTTGTSLCCIMFFPDGKSKIQTRMKNTWSGQFLHLRQFTNFYKPRLVRKKKLMGVRSLKLDGARELPFTVQTAQFWIWRLKRDMLLP